MSTLDLIVPIDSEASDEGKNFLEALTLTSDTRDCDISVVKYVLPFHYVLTRMEHFAHLLEIVPQKTVVIMLRSFLCRSSREFVLVAKNQK